MKAILLVSHGSRSAKTKEEILATLDILRKQVKAAIFEIAFLEIEPPNIPEGINICVSKGATEVIVLLNFLNSGRHVNNDIPEIVRQASVKYPHVHISITTPVGQHPRIVDLFTDLIKNV